MDKIKIFALGGLDENGKNLYVIELNDDIFVVECGLKFPNMGNMPGIEIIIPKFNYLIDNRDRIKGIIISHGHDDQLGSLPYLMRKIKAPIYATNTTIEIIKIVTASLKLKVDYDFHPIPASGSFEIAHHIFHTFATSHSIAESFGFALETSLGQIVYTGDFIADYASKKNYNFDINALSKIADKPTLILLPESMGAEKPGSTSPNHRITPRVSHYIEEAEGRVIVSLYSQNFYNISEVIDITVKCGKKICFIDPTFSSNYEIFSMLGDISVPRGYYVPLSEINRYRDKDLVMILTGSGDKLFHSMFELGNHTEINKQLQLGEKDIFINACPAVPGTEVVATSAIDEIYKTGATVVNLSRKEISSMHAQEEDLKLMISMLRPKYYLPVKGEYRHLMANAKIAVNSGMNFNHLNTFILDNGMVLSIDEKGVASVVTGTPILVSDMLIDSNGIVDVKGTVVEERATMGDEGTIILGIVVSSKLKKRITKPDIQMRGFLFLRDSENIVREINRIFSEGIDELIRKNGFTIADSEKKICSRLGYYIRKQTGKECLLLPEIIDIDNLQGPTAKKSL